MGETVANFYSNGNLWRPRRYEPEERMDDEFLVRQAASGERGAFRLLVLRYQRPIFRFLGIIGFSPAQSEDIAQETFLRAFRALAQFDPAKGKFSTWLFTIAKRLAATEQRRNRPSSTAIHDDLNVVDPAPGPGERALAADELRRVTRALDALSDELRTTLVLARVEELSLEQVADLQGCAVGTVKSRIHRASERLRVALVEEDS